MDHPREIATPKAKKAAETAISLQPAPRSAAHSPTPPQQGPLTPSPPSPFGLAPPARRCRTLAFTSTMSPPSPRTSRLAPNASPPGAAWSDLTSSWIWPRILLAPTLGARFVPLMLGILAVAAISLTDRLLAAAGLLPANTHPVGETLSRWLIQLNQLLRSLTVAVTDGGTSAASDIEVLLVTIPQEQYKLGPTGAIISWIVAIAAFALASTGIARTAALAMGRHPLQPLHAVVKFALRRAFSSIVGLLLPWLCLIICIALLAGAGWLLLSFQYVQVAGAVVVGVAGIPAGIVVAFLAVGTILGTPLMVPAIAAEGTDALDAIQRIMAYVRAGFTRLILYWAIALATIFIVANFANTFASLVSLAAIAATSHLVTLPQGPTSSSTLTNTILDFWQSIIIMLAKGYILSVAVCAFTLVYLAIRRWVDGQDVGEIWIDSAGPGLRTDLVAGDGADEE